MTDVQPQRLAARYVGSSVIRKEDRRLVTGHGQYVDDVTLPGQLYLAFRRSDVAKATIRSIDTSAAEALPGVVRVFTAETMNGLHGEAWHGMLGEAMATPPPLAMGAVKYAGDPIACVVATSRYIAEDACELIDIDLDMETPAVDYRSAAADTEHIVHGDWGLASNAMVEVPFMAIAPDLDDAFAKAAHVVEADVEQNRYICVPMETRGMNASWNDGTQELLVYLSGQSTHGTRDYYARYLKIPEANITVDMRDVGGGFGSKMFVFREENAVVLATRILNRPVKWIEDRRENLISGPHSRNEWARGKIAIDGDGTITAIAALEHKADVGAFPVCPAAMDSSLITGPYKIPRTGFSTSMVWTNTMGKGAYRGPWMFETTFREMMIDIAARDSGLDPVELRRKNLLSGADMPYATPMGQTFDEITPLETLEQAVEMLGYEDFRREQAAARAEGRYLGVGFAVYVEPTTMNAPTLHSEGCTVRVERDGRVTAYLGTTSHGQSIETTMAQVVADTLGVDYEDVSVVQGTSRGTPWGGGTGGSRTATLAGNAAHGAAQAVRDKVLNIAAHQMEASPDDLQMEAGVVSVKGTPTKSVTLKEIATGLYTNPSDLAAAGIEPSIEATVRFQPNKFPTYSNATHVCVIEIDGRTWIPKILRYIVSEDCGKMINPTVVEGQIFGGVVQGIGGVLLENFVYDADGNPLTTTFMDYLLPTTTEIPDIEVGHIETPSSTNPGGFKGMGEGGAIGSHAAVANAVGDALHHLGVRVTRTPLGPNDIFELVKQAGAL